MIYSCIKLNEKNVHILSYIFVRVQSNETARYFEFEKKAHFWGINF